MMLSLKEIKNVMQARMLINKDPILMPGLNRAYQEICVLIEALEHKVVS